MDGSGEVTKRFVPWLTLVVSVSAIVFQKGGEAFFDALVWRSDWLARGEVWRLASGHFVHVSSSHLIWDLGVFLMLGYYLEMVDRRHFIGTIGLCIVLTEIALSLSGRFNTYCGLSAMDVGLFGSVCFRFCIFGSRSRDFLIAGIGGLGLLLMAGKLGFELLANDALFVGELARGYSVASESHLAGFMAALIVSTLSFGNLRRLIIGPRYWE